MTFSNCGCNSSQGIYGTNMWNVNGNTTASGSCGHVQSCNSCVDIAKGKCVLYTGSNLTSIGVNTNDTLDAILVKLDALKAIQDTKNTAQDTKNANILTALNDINARLNTLAGGTPHPPYTI